LIGGYPLTEDGRGETGMADKARRMRRKVESEKQRFRDSKGGKGNCGLMMWCEHGQYQEEDGTPVERGGPPRTVAQKSP